MTERDAYRITEVSQKTGIPVSTIRARIHDGDIKVITSFGPWLIAKDEYHRLLKSMPLK